MRGELRRGGMGEVAGATSMRLGVGTTNGVGCGIIGGPVMPGGINILQVETEPLLLQEEERLPGQEEQQPLQQPSGAEPTACPQRPESRPDHRQKHPARS